MPNQAAGIDADGQPLNVHGWFYDDFSSEVENCPSSAGKQRVAFTNTGGVNAQPPSGVTVRLECLQQAASLTVPRTDIDPSNLNPASIGSPCDTHENCHVTLATPESCIAGRVFRSPVPYQGGLCVDVQMFCHPAQKVCVAECGNKSECLPGFECDSRQATTGLTNGMPDPAFPSGAGRPICVNPTCGE
jgi:hypothetical protein